MALALTLISSYNSGCTPGGFTYAGPSYPESTPNVSIPSGSRLVVVLSYDNESSTGSDPFVSFYAVIGNTQRASWTTNASVTNNPSGSLSGCCLRILTWTTVAAMATTTNTDWFTADFSPISVNNAMYRVYWVTGTGTISIPAVSGNTAIGTTTSTVKVAGVTTTENCVAPELLICGISVESGSETYTGATSSSNGSWTTVESLSMGGGAATGLTMFIQTKLITGTGIQDFDGSLSGSGVDWAAGYMKYSDQSSVSSSYKPIDPLGRNGFFGI